MKKTSNLSEKTNLISKNKPLLTKTSKEKIISRDKSKQLKLCAELSDLIVYFKSINFRGFNHADHKFYNISSFNETKAKWLINKSNDEALVHHEKHLSRVYPGASRTNSSNFDPTIFWASGFQMIAINYQTTGVEREIYFGKFKQNGNCGFVRKPDFIANFSKIKDLKLIKKLIFENYFTVNKLGCQSKPRRYKIKIITGQQLPKPRSKLQGEIVDPFVRVDIYGDERDKIQYETEWVPNNGFNPFWDDYTEIIVNHPDVAMIRFSVWDKDAVTSNDFLGQYSLPLTCCQVGYRHINLEDENGRALRPASIFVHIEFEVLEKFDVTERKKRNSSIASTHKQNVKKTIELGKFAEEL